MRRSASEIIRNLETRIARLEQTKTASGGLPLEVYFYEGKVGVAVEPNTEASEMLKSRYILQEVKKQPLGYEILYFKDPRLTFSVLSVLRMWGGGTSTTRGKLTSKNSTVAQRISVLKMIDPHLYGYFEAYFDLTTTEITIYP